MKTFIFSQRIVKTSRTYGCSTIECTVYAVKNNKPTFLGNVEYNTASTMGAISEVNKFLLDNKHIPKTWSRRRSQTDNNDTKMYNSNYYHSFNQDKYRIYEIGRY